MAAGQPTKYNVKMQKLTEEYISSYSKHGHVVPSIVGLAGVLGVVKATLYNWADTKGNEKFLDTLDALRQKQEEIVLNSGLTGDFNSTIAKLVLHNHGYSDKQQIEAHVGELPSINDYYKD